MQATGTYGPTSWDEGPYADLDGAPKLTHARITNTYRGDLEGNQRVGDGKHRWAVDE